jgi:hypothetical protein
VWGARCWVLKEQTGPAPLERVGGLWGGVLLRSRTGSSVIPHPVLVERVGVGAGTRGWGRWLFENCTVDASIFVSVVKFVRAYGGCLGTRSR